MWIVGHAWWMKSAAWHVPGGWRNFPPAAYYLPPTTHHLLPAPFGGSTVHSVRYVVSNRSAVAECTTVPTRNLVVPARKFVVLARKLVVWTKKLVVPDSFPLFLPPTTYNALYIHQKVRTSVPRNRRFGAEIHQFSAILPHL
jgi:hypothetical protein